jgi:general secretion pathway protein K
VLQDFRAVNSGLRSPAEGWADPLGFAGYTPSEGRRVEVAFEDESGKISLPRADVQVLQDLFKSWEVDDTDAEMLADALIGWMRPEHVYSTAVSPRYDDGETPFDAPARPIRSYSELAAIEKVREFFYDANGQPNDYWRRFVASVSLFNFEKTNINGAKPEVLAAVGRFDTVQQRMLGDYFGGRGQYETTGPGFVRDPSEAASIAGPAGNTQAFGATITALRVVITVYEGKSEFRLAAVVAPQNGARVVRQTARHPEMKAGAQPTPQQQKSGANAQQAKTSSGQAGTDAQNLRYPFTVLEIRENDEIPPLPAPPAEETSP